jgi:prepilin-type N-terminal cleavage/methylation domain-containing protein
VLSGGAPGDERGYTLIELLVTMSILMVVVGALFGALISGMHAESRASTRIDDEQAVGTVLAQFTHDVRSADGLGSGTQLPDEVDLDEVGGGTVRWVFDPDAGLLTRYLGSTTGVHVDGLGSGTAFALQDGAGNALGATAGDTAADVLDCAATVSVSVAVDRDDFVEMASGPLRQEGATADPSGVADVETAASWPGCAS